MKLFVLVKGFVIYLQYNGFEYQLMPVEIEKV